MGAAYGNRQVYAGAGGYLLFYFARPMHVKVNVANMKTTGNVMKNIYFIGIPATSNLASLPFRCPQCNPCAVSREELYSGARVYYKLQTFIYLMANGIVQGNPAAR